MTASSNRERPVGTRGHAARKSRQFQQQPGIRPAYPAAGAHAAPHLTNEDATPGAGVLPRLGHDGKEVDGAAG